MILLGFACLIVLGLATLFNSLAVIRINKTLDNHNHTLKSFLAINESQVKINDFLIGGRR